MNTQAQTQTRAGKIICSLEEIQKRFEGSPLKDLAFYSDFKKKVEEFKEIIEKKSEQQKTFTISVVGDVKVGKSTLLNALLFDGTEILPEAFTPQTASLSILRKSRDEKHHASIEFIQNPSEKQMEILRDKAKHFYEEYKNYGYSFDCDDRQKFAEKIKDFVVADENSDSTLNCSAVVKSTTLEFPDLLDKDRMDLQIVDTPGLNDPDLERSEKTENFLRETDAIMYLSVNSFHTEDEKRTLQRDLLKNGISKILLIRSKWDEYFNEESVLDDNYRDEFCSKDQNFSSPKDRLIAFIQSETRETNKKFQTRMKIAEKEDSRPILKEHWQKLSEKSIYPVSSMWFKYASHPEIKPDPSLFDNYEENIYFSQEDFQNISGFTELNEQYEKLKKEKAKTFEELLKGMMNANTIELQDMISSSKKELDFQKKDLEKSLEEIKNEINDDERCLKELGPVIQERLKEHFKQFGEGIRKQKKYLKELAEEFRIEPSQMSKKIPKEPSGWKKFWKIFFPCIKDDYYTKLQEGVEYPYVIALLEEFYEHVKSYIQKTVEELKITLGNRSQNGVKEIIIELLYDKEMIPSDFLKNTIDDLEKQLKNYKLDEKLKELQEYKNKFSKFKDNVDGITGAAFENLKETFKSVQCELIADTVNKFEPQIEKMDGDFNEWINKFVKNCKDKMNVRLEECDRNAKERDKKLEETKTQIRELDKLNAQIGSLKEI